ncbi:radical SAM family heme chaperone HemW [Aquimarina sp. TRL1]|uniref:radical SAM family heme chaperone HemW n=1 Tax=Aquimarina sp. (strain TRL1) TaxID=2736252 RepID=UPI00158D9471|nr:radical SAM family heme chaperone HemW [Aquimarina sp. TRL1]QKX07540.1 radical SAM family heme chaperone HemW [Aquimarina sp. TRL1]
MSGIYIHIPFCKQACHYCDFHFSTSLKRKDQMIFALCEELKIRRSEVADYEIINTIYFGGGTPSILKSEEIRFIIDTIYETYLVADEAEITLEANPDDLTPEAISIWANSPINRLSIGIQSFFEEDLEMMNRAHSAEEALQCLQLAAAHFDNISIDLIYGIPGMTIDRWKQNLELALASKVPHISSYALTVEPKTALDAYIRKGKIPAPRDEVAQQHFELLIDTLETAGFINYEFSNFGKPGFFSKNNTAYWQGKPYLGIGPSAHSFNGIQRSWNIPNNIKYIDALAQKELPREIETLSTQDRYNEYIMTGLRTIWGVSLTKVLQEYGDSYHSYLLQHAQRFIDKQLLTIEDNTLLITKKGKFLSDGIASDLFFLNLT